MGLLLAGTEEVEGRDGAGFGFDFDALVGETESVLEDVNEDEEEEGPWSLARVYFGGGGGGRGGAAAGVRYVGARATEWCSGQRQGQSSAQGSPSFV